jgi:hypothetical protein
MLPRTPVNSLIFIEKYQPHRIIRLLYPNPAWQRYPFDRGTRGGFKTGEKEAPGRTARRGARGINQPKRPVM